MPNNSSRGGIRSVHKALQILEAFDGQHPSLRVSDLAKQLGLPKSTVHGLLRTLHAHGFVQQLETGRVYALGPRLLELGRMADTNILLVEYASDLLRGLSRATGETAKLSVRVGDTIVGLFAAESPHVLHTRGDVGVAAPLHCTSLGKAVLAFLSPAELDRFLRSGPLRTRTPRTITRPAALLRELQTTRARGYAIDAQESEADVRCVGAPILDARGTPVAAVSISAPSQRMPMRRLRALGRRIARTADLITQHLRAEPGAPARGVPVARRPRARM